MTRFCSLCACGLLHSSVAISAAFIDWQIFSLLAGLPSTSTQVSLDFYFWHQFVMCLTRATFLVIPHATVLAYWHGGTSFCILVSTIPHCALHNVRIVYIYAQVYHLNRLPGHFITKFLDPGPLQGMCSRRPLNRMKQPR